MSNKLEKASLRSFIGLFVTIISLLLFVNGCSQQSVASIVLNGLYVESTSGESMGLYFGSDGVSWYVHLLQDPTTGKFTGDCLSYGSQYSLVGNTVRVVGGTLTADGQAFSMFTPPGGGNVGLLTLNNNGQSLDLTLNNGTVVSFIKQ